MSGRAGRALVTALAAVIVASGSLSLCRAGYTPDEEYTVFAVRGIAAGGLPVLPSGLLYDRGLLYSYLSWFGAFLTGLALPAFRAISLAAAALTLVVGHRAIARAISPAAGVAAAGLVAASIPFWAAATTGRFYALFVAALVALVAVLGDAPVVSRHGQRTLWWCALALLAAAARLTHELAFTVMAIPVTGALLAWLDEPAVECREASRRWLGVGAALAVGLAAAQGLLFAVHFLSPPPEGGRAMIERFFLWQVLNLFERPHGLPLGIVSSLAVVGVLVAPRRANPLLRAAALAAAAAIVIWPAVTWFTSAPVTRADLFTGSLTYPLDMFWHMAAGTPVLVWTALGLLVARLLGAGGEWPSRERAAHLAWVGWVLWFGVIESGITINYLLLPTMATLAAIGIDLVAIGQHTAALWPGRRGQVARAVLTGVGLTVAADQWRGTGSLLDRLAAARPTIEVAGIADVRESLMPGDVVACTDELACVLLVGRVDAWLALDDFVRERFVVVRRDGAAVGVYAGAPAIERPRALLERAAADVPLGRVLVMDVFKEYPVGNSRAWLPRALARDAIEPRVLLESPQARVVEIGVRHD